MKRKIFTLFLCVLFVAGAYAQQPTGVIKKASVAPEVDGVIDEVWAEANVYNIDQNFQAEEPTLGSQGETTWQALWTDDGMYVLLKVTDDAFYPAYVTGGNDYEYDKPELYFDVNYILQDALGPAGTGTNAGHYQFAPPFVDGLNDGTLQEIANKGGAEVAFMVDDPNYVAEYYIPFSFLLDKDGVGIDLTGNVGFDVTIIDRDPGDAARKRAVWANIGNITESWSNMDDCGIITFEGAEAPVLIESITLTGGEITVDNGTLQIAAAILPEEATNKNLGWSVENGTGKASISSTGLLTGIANGTVTVTAAAKDGSYEEASVDVTISGQVTRLWELNIIPNGNFDLVNIDGTATGWSGWGGDANSPLPQIVDGVAVCTPVETTLNYQYQFNESNLTALPNVDYIFRFKAWAEADRTFCVDFEDIADNGYTRYGASSDPEATGGRSEWTFDVTTEPLWYTFHVNFDQMVETTVQKVQFMLGLAGDVTYIDSVELVTLEEYNTVSVPALNSVSKVKLYPNPIDGSNRLTVVLPSVNSKVTIFDSMGRKVEEVIETGNQAVFNVSHYARGVYFVKVNDEPVQKFIK